jgi:hypothetical protein
LINCFHPVLILSIYICDGAPLNGGGGDGTVRPLTNLTFVRFMHVFDHFHGRCSWGI